MGKRRLCISAELILDLLQPGTEIHERCLEGLPVGTKVNGAWVNWQIGGGVVELMVEHPDWDESPHGQKLPAIYATFEKLEPGK